MATLRSKDGRLSANVFQVRSRGVWAYKIRDLQTGQELQRRQRKTKNAAMDAAQAALRALSAELRADGHTVTGLLDRWLQARTAATARGDLRATTLQNDHDHARIVRQHLPTLAATPIQTLTTGHITDAIDRLGDVTTRTGIGYSARTRSQVAMLLRQVLDDAVDRGWIETNPADRAKAPGKPRGTPKGLDREARDRFRQALHAAAAGECRGWASTAGYGAVPVDTRADQSRAAAMGWLGFGAGLRPAEVLGLPLDAIDLEDGHPVLHVGMQTAPTGRDPVTGKRRTMLQATAKTDAGVRTVPLPACVAGPLQAWLPVRERWEQQARADGTWNPDPDGMPLVFPTRSGRVQSPSNHRTQSHLRLCAHAEVEVTPHGLRHTAATVLLEEGLDTRIIMDILGHVEPRMMMLYIRVLGASRARARDAMQQAHGDT